MADQKITQLTADTSPTSDDLVVTVTDPAGTPANRKVTLGDLPPALGGAHTTTFDPTVDQGASTDIAHTVNWSHHVKVGRTIFWAFRLAMTATGTAGSEIRIDLPEAEATNTNIYAGAGAVVTFNGGLSYKVQIIIRAGTQQIALIRTDDTNITALGVNPSAGIVNGTLILGFLTYETAA